MDLIYELQADVLRTLAHPRRLQIIHLLAQGPRDVGSLATDLGVTQPNASQHLAVLRAGGLVVGDRRGREVWYRVSDPEILSACALMRGVLDRRNRHLAAVSAAAWR